MLAGLLLVGAFAAREFLVWFFGKVLDALPIPKTASGAIDVSAIPWGDLIAWAILIAGTALFLLGLAGIHVRFPALSFGKTAAGPVDGNIAEEVARQIGRLALPVVPEDIVRQSDVQSRDDAIAELAKKLGDLSATTIGTLKLQDARIEALTSRVSEIATDGTRLKAGFDDWSRQHTDSNRRQFGNIDNGFRAIHDRETLLGHVKRIEDGATWLLRTRDGEAVENWADWSARQSQWFSAISEYCNIAKRYRPECWKSIREVSPSQLTGDWPEDRTLFPSDDAMIAHRTVAATLINFHAENETVMRSVTAWAFQSPSQKGGLSAN